MAGKRGVVLRQGVGADDAENGPGAAGQVDLDWLAGFDQGRAQAIATFCNAWDAGRAAGASAEELCLIARSGWSKQLPKVYGAPASIPRGTLPNIST